MSNTHYLSPYSTTKNIGGAINKAITQLAANGSDWVVICDHDVLWLLPDSKAQLKKILNTTDYDILSPVTNRLAMTHQLHQGMSDVWDIKQHIEVAKSRQAMQYGQVEQTRQILAAFCLCFRVSTWQKLGGFAENNIQFDSLFCMAADRIGMKLGIMLGIYIFHLYRPWSDNPARDFKHLINETKDKSV